MSTLTKLELSVIRTDGGTQTRAKFNQEVIEEYADAMKAGVLFPPVEVFYDGQVYWLADGFHRLAAADLAGLRTIPVDLRQGTRREAVLFSVGANAAHGLRRTNADKRQSVATLLNDPEWSQWSDREIARQAGVSDRFVNRLRKELTANRSQSTSRKAANGRIINVANIGKRIKDSATPSPPSPPGSTTQSESPDIPKPPEEEQPNLIEPTPTAVKSYKAGDRIRILCRQHGEDEWSGKTARIREITPDGWIRVDVEGHKGVRFTLNPDWVEPMSETPELTPQAAPQSADEPDPETPAMAFGQSETIADAASEELPASQVPQAGVRLRLANLEQSGQQWVGEVAEVIEVAEGEIEVIVKIRPNSEK